MTSNTPTKRCHYHRINIMQFTIQMRPLRDLYTSKRYPKFAFNFL